MLALGLLFTREISPVNSTSLRLAKFRCPVALANTCGGPGPSGEMAGNWSIVEAISARERASRQWGCPSSSCEALQSVADARTSGHPASVQIHSRGSSSRILSPHGAKYERLVVKNFVRLPSCFCSSSTQAAASINSWSS